MKTRVGILFIITGLLIVSWALYARWGTDHKQKAMMEQFNKAVENYGVQGNEIPPSDDKNASKAINPLEIDNMIGILEIPKIDLKVAVVDGVDAESLKIAVGHFKETAMPGEKGNCAISGHRSYTYNQFFNRLNEVEVKDEITINTKTGNYKYIVSEKKIIDPSDVSVLNKTDEPVITLITCHPERSSAQRLIIRGRLLKQATP